MDLKAFYLRFRHVLDWFNLAPTRVVPLVMVTLGFLTEREVKGETFRSIGGRVDILESSTRSLYRNGIVCVRVMLPFFVGVFLRWRWDDTTAKSFLTMHAGWKLSGELGFALRVQSDESSARGTTGPNAGQAWGLSDGDK